MGSVLCYLLKMNKWVDQNLCKAVSRDISKGISTIIRVRNEITQGTDNKTKEKE